MAAQLFHYAGDGRFLLTDGDVDADNVLALLVYDSVERYCGLTGLTVADDELTLAAADRNERVDGLEAGLHGHGDGLSCKHARCRALDRTEGICLDGTLAVDGAAHSVDNAADKRFADGNLDYTTGAADTVALLQVAERSEQDDADIVLV